MLYEGKGNTVKEDTHTNSTDGNDARVIACAQVLGYFSAFRAARAERVGTTQEWRQKPCAHWLLLMKYGRLLPVGSGTSTTLNLFLRTSTGSKVHIQTPLPKKNPSRASLDSRENDFGLSHSEVNILQQSAVKVHALVIKSRTEDPSSNDARRPFPFLLGSSTSKIPCTLYRRRY